MAWLGALDACFVNVPPQATVEHTVSVVFLCEGDFCLDAAVAVQGPPVAAAMPLPVSWPAQIEVEGNL